MQSFATQLLFKFFFGKRGKTYLHVRPMHAALAAELRISLHCRKLFVEWLILSVICVKSSLMYFFDPDSEELDSPT